MSDDAAILDDSWGLIKYERPFYAKRRTLIRDAFRQLIEYLEAYDRAPGVALIAETLEGLYARHVHATWQKVLDHRAADPEGAITTARMLVETVCKHILDNSGGSYAEDSDLPKLWTLVAEQANLAPHQHQEGVFRAMTGNCQAVTSNLSSVCKRVCNSQGQGRRLVKPKAGMRNWQTISPAQRRPSR